MTCNTPWQPSSGDFRRYFGATFASEEEYPEVQIQDCLFEAMNECRPCVFRGYYRRALYHLTAHFLTLWRERQNSTELDSTGSAASASKGVISSVSVGDLSLTMEMPEYSSSSDDKFLASTIFGQEFIRLRNKMSRGSLLARIPLVGGFGCGGCP